MSHDAADDYIRSTTPEQREQREQREHNRNKWEGRIETNQEYSIKALDKIETRLDGFPTLIASVVSQQLTPLAASIVDIKAIQATDGKRITALEKVNDERAGVKNHWTGNLSWAVGGGGLFTLISNFFHSGGSIPPAH
jgi:hypothetical protein